MKSRVLFLDHVGVIGGAELAMLDVARAYRDTSTVVLFADGPFRQRLADEGIHVRVVEGSSPLHAVRRDTRWPSPAAISGLLSLVRRLVPIARDHDGLLANTQKAFVTACLVGLIARRPVVWELHDLLTPDHFSRMNIRLDVALANACAARVIANSQASADAFVAQGGRPDRLCVVHNGISPAPFDAVSDDSAADARRELGLAGVPLAGVFSRLGRWKGQDVALDALAQVPRAHLLLVGDALFGEDDYVRALHARAARPDVAGRVHFLGFRKDVPRLMRAVDVVAHTSSSPEPFGRVVVEGMLARAPVVATGAGGAREIVTDGITGILVPPGDSPALAQALQRLLTNRAEAARLARNGRLRAVARFSVHSMVQRKSLDIEQAFRSASQPWASPHARHSRRHQH